MKEIYMLNKGDNVDKISYEYEIDGKINILQNKYFDFKFVELTKGTDDVLIVKNYLPVYEYIVKKNETVLDILSRGFKIENTEMINEGDVVVINKPKSIRYITKPLDKLEDIAKKIGVDKNYIMMVNNLKTDKLFVGQILWI